MGAFCVRESHVKIAPFKVESWMNAWETGARYNIAETCVDSVSLDELCALTGENKEAFLRTLCARRLTYGYIEGNPRFREGVCSLYQSLKVEDIVPTHGASGANHHLFYTLVEPGDEVVVFVPTYQQLYSIPESYGAKVIQIALEEKDGYHPNLDKLRKAVGPKTRLICLNNPNNPTGALMDEESLKEIVALARSVGAWVLCDEVYRHLTQNDGYCPSIADLYEKGISISSMSKVFSLAGIRLGWIATRNRLLVKDLLSHRDYDLVSCGMIDEEIAALALSHASCLLERNRTLVRTNLTLLDAWVAQEPHVRYVKPQAGTTALVFYDLDVPSYELCEEMYRKEGAFVTPGDCFEIPHSFRIGYASDTNVLVEGLKAMSRYFSWKSEEMKR